MFTFCIDVSCLQKIPWEKSQFTFEFWVFSLPQGLALWQHFACQFLYCLSVVKLYYGLIDLDHDSKVVVQGFSKVKLSKTMQILAFSANLSDWTFFCSDSLRKRLDW